MAARNSETLTHHLRRIVLRVDGAGMTDGQLLEAFIKHRDAAAFEALVRRHGPMVLGVCRRILRDRHDADDAFQATFLVLARKAASVSPREMVGNWLYGVAQTTAIRARATNAKRRSRERPMVHQPEREEVPNNLPDDLHERLDEELARLPDKYRVPIVLCHLEGRTRREVARQLKIPEGTLSSRLATARAILAKRLARHGLAVSGGALAAVLSPSAASAVVPVSLASSTVKAATLAAAGHAATGIISVQAAALTQGVLKVMFLTKLKTIAGVMLIVASLCGAAGLIYPTQASEQPKARKAIEKADKEKQPGARNNEKSEPAKQQKPKNDREAIRGVWRVISVQHGDEDGADERDMMSKECRWVIHTHSIDMRSQGGMVGLNYKLDPSRSPKVLDLQLLGRNIPTIYALEGDILRIRMGLHEKTRPKALFTKTPGQTMLLTLKREPTKPKAPKAIEKADKEIQPTAKKPRPDKEQLQGKWKIIASVDDGKKELNVAEEWTFKDSMVKAVSPAAYFRFRLNETTNPKRIDFAEGKADDLFDMAAFEKRLDNADARNEGIYALIGDTLIICISRTKGERPTAFESKEGSDYILMTLQRQRPQDDKKPQEKGGKGEVTRPRTDKETAQSFRLVPHSHTFRLKAREFTIPVHVDPDAKLKRLQLNVSVDAGETWQTVDSIPTTARAFRFKAPKDGTYWFIVQSVFRDGKLRPVALLRPDLKIVVDTTNKPDND